MLFIFALVCLFTDIYLIYIIFNFIGDTKLFINSAYVILSINPLTTINFVNYSYILILNKFIKFIILLIMSYLNYYYSKFKYFNKISISLLMLNYILIVYV